MPAHAAAIEALADQLRGFLRQPDQKLLHVIATPDLRKGAMATAMAAEHAPENVAAFVLFAQPHTADAPGWRLRAGSAREQHDSRREGAEPPIPALPPAPEAKDALVAFAEQLWQLLDRKPPGSDGLVVVLAPSQVEDAKAWASALSRVVMGNALSQARFIVIDVESSTIAPVFNALGDRARVHETQLPDDAAAQAVAQAMRGVAGAAPSDVQPPARADDPPKAPVDEEATLRKAVGDKVLVAALAMGNGDAVGAVTAQRQARDLCAAAGKTDDALQMELLLGGQLNAAGQPKAAEQSFDRALAGAQQAGKPDKVATAGFAVGAVRLAQGERHTALVAYAQAAVAAEQSGQPLLAVEGNRLAGQAAADIKMEPQAITFFTRAVKLAETVPPETVHRTTASHAARGLAALCRKRKLTERAAELTAQAERFETPIQPLAEPETFTPDATTVEAFSPPPRAPNPEATLVEASPAAGPDLFAVEASIPPADLLAPPLLVLPTLEAASGPAVAPPALSTTATPDDFGEGTSLLTLNEIADMHWGGDTSAPASGPRPWTPGEIEILQSAVSEALEPEATTMLSYEELAALRGEVLPTRPAPVAQHAPSEEVDELAGLESVHEEAAPPPQIRAPQSDAGDAAFNPEDVTMLSFDDIASMREAMLKKKRDDDT